MGKKDRRKKHNKYSEHSKTSHWTRNPRGSRASDCTKKGRYPTHRVAQERIQRYRDKKGVELTTYHCHVCQGWHLTSAKSQLQE